eukprot:2908429-Pyramimonas_sp.AAC.1
MHALCAAGAIGRRRWVGAHRQSAMGPSGAARPSAIGDGTADPLGSIADPRWAEVCVAQRRSGGPIANWRWTMAPNVATRMARR